MNLDFGILWIEDAFDNDEKSLLERRVLDSGFIARIDNIPNGDGLEDIARTNQLFHRYDLILLDYRLQNAMGDELASVVRSLFPATNILFYSGTIDEDELRSLIADRKVEGVFCSRRDRFVERAGELINQFSSSINRLSGMRGLSMRVVAECDEILAQAVKFMTDCEEKCAAKMDDLDEDVLSFIEDTKNKYEAAANGDFDDRLASRAIDSSKLHKHFRRQSRVVTQIPDSFGLSPEQVDRIRELRASTAQYEETVLGTRNILGHVIEKESAEGWVLSGRADIQVSDFPQIRRTFASHINDFTEMRNLICSLMDKQTD